MADKVFDICFIIGGIATIIFRDKFLQYMIDIQKEMFRNRILEERMSKSGWLMVVMGVVFIIVGTLALLGLAFTK